MLAYLDRRMDRLTRTAAANWQPLISDLKSQILNLIPRCESISRQLRGWADSLQNTDIRGQRHLNDQSRTAYDQNRRSDEFWKRIRREQEERAAKRHATADGAESSDSQT
jgi:hypothetical protein